MWDGRILTTATIIKILLIPQLKSENGVEENAIWEQLEGLVYQKNETGKLLINSKFSLSIPNTFVH